MHKWLDPETYLTLIDPTIKLQKLILALPRDLMSTERTTV
jgi:hypothetical protein